MSTAPWLDDFARTVMRAFDEIVVAVRSVSWPTLEALDRDLDGDGLRYRAHGEMLLLRATRAHPPRAPRATEHRHRARVPRAARRVRRRWRTKGERRGIYAAGGACGRR